MGDPTSPAYANHNRAQETASALLYGVTTRRGATATAQRVRTRAAARAPTFNIADWASRTLIKPPEPPPANFNPSPAPQPRDAAAAQDFVQRRESVVRYLRDAIAAAVDRQKEL
ncbi:hypothetical protein PC117_g13076 [Phytophthora cactorum]|uniref:Uncharacterized protein n=1 Tax=Phytophthora cactorum TaxID=29920 RepID=A0A8T1D3A6_9STRA|nr:hypothetical protein PC117_g13076 [Phytophthora cactorum]